MSIHDLAVKLICKMTPIRQNRIVFDSYYGRGYGDSPKAICEVLRKSGEDLELLWLCRDEAAAKAAREEK
jgi:CDP-glycerol glycerophosphotransferase (TagB/SpsB family)